MFGTSRAPQNEETEFSPCSPYGVAKLASYWMGRTYRDAYGMFIANGILFNHESPLRGEDFVTRKIVRGVAAIKAGAQNILTLGNLDSVRDWGHARDYVEGMWMMLQQEKPDDYVLATGKAQSVRQFVELAFAHTGVEIEWQGRGIRETGRCRKTGRIMVAVDSALFRPKEVHYLLGDAAKARRELGWAPRVSFEELVAEMVNAEREMFFNTERAENTEFLKVVSA
jgi:GDPmannose 4,6-dehydratase